MSLLSSFINNLKTAGITNSFTLTSTNAAATDDDEEDYDDRDDDSDDDIILITSIITMAFKIMIVIVFGMNAIISIIVIFWGEKLVL